MKKGGALYELLQFLGYIAILIIGVKVITWLAVGL